MPISRVRRGPSHQCRGRRGESEAASDERENDRMGVVICCWTRSRESPHQGFSQSPPRPRGPLTLRPRPTLLPDPRDGRGAGLLLPPAPERSLFEGSLFERSLSERSLFGCRAGRSRCRNDPHRLVSGRLGPSRAVRPQFPLLSSRSSVPAPRFPLVGSRSSSLPTPVRRHQRSPTAFYAHRTGQTPR
jgi:hypothetical protein